MGVRWITSSFSGKKNKTFNLDRPCYPTVPHPSSSPTASLALSPEMIQHTTHTHMAVEGDLCERENEDRQEEDEEQRGALGVKIQVYGKANVLKKDAINVLHFYGIIMGAER